MYDHRFAKDITVELDYKCILSSSRNSAVLPLEMLSYNMGVTVVTDVINKCITHFSEPAQILNTE